MNKIEFGDCRDTMRRWAEQGIKAQTCVTSPPYFGLRDYGHEGQIGLEQTPEEYIAAMVEVFRCVRNVLADDGTLWLNLGSSYASGDKTPSQSLLRQRVPSCDTHGTSWMLQPLAVHTKGKESFFSACRRSDCNGIGGCGYCFGSLITASLNIKQKDELNIPHLVAMALQADGWVLRQTICWAKPNPMPESVRDRCTKAHEYVFLLSKSGRYFFDSEAMREPAAFPSLTHRSAKKTPQQEAAFLGNAPTNLGRCGTAEDGMRNRRSVWTVATKPFKGAHFATFPPALIEPCILAGSQPGDIVLDPFMGSGTTAAVALQHGRQYLGCELNPEYKPLQDERIAAANDSLRR